MIAVVRVVSEPIELDYGVVHPAVSAVHSGQVFLGEFESKGLESCQGRNRPGDLSAILFSSVILFLGEILMRRISSLRSRTGDKKEEIVRLKVLKCLFYKKKILIK